MNTMPQIGKVANIVVRTEKRALPIMIDNVMLDAAQGLVGDHYSGRSGKRQVTLIQYEHLVAVASILGIDLVDPLLTRRNIVVSGINLLALKNQRFRIGNTLLETTGTCEPCSRMEANLGPGGYNAMRGHGGICAKILLGGNIAVGAVVKLEIE